MSKSESSKNCSDCLSKSDGFLTCAPTAILAKIWDKKTVKSFKKGNLLFSSGEKAKGIYCIQSGVVKVTATGESGKSHILRLSGPGDILGYRSFLADEAYRADALATEDVKACYIPKDVFSKAVFDSPELAQGLIKKLSHDVGEAESRLSSTTDKEAPRRVAEALLFLKSSFPNHKWTRKDIAEWTSTTPETVMRVLSIFLEKKHIKNEGRKIQILNKNALLKIAQLDT